ncbi:MAG: hypothetical protein ABI664_09025 [bacterium]
MLGHSVLVTLRFLHIVSGVFWAGSAFALAGFIVWAPSRSSEDDDRFVGRLMLERRLMYALVGSALVAIGSGVGLFRTLYGRSEWDWSHVTANEVYAIGFFAAVLALLLMLGAGIPVGLALRRCGTAIDAIGGVATHVQRVERERLGRRGALVWRLTAALLFITVATMAVGRYVF